MTCAFRYGGDLLQRRDTQLCSKIKAIACVTLLQTTCDVCVALFLEQSCALIVGCCRRVTHQRMASPRQLTLRINRNHWDPTAEVCKCCRTHCHTVHTHTTAVLNMQVRDVSAAKQQVGNASDVQMCRHHCQITAS